MVARGSMVIFAYGSNMLSARLRLRVPSARVIATGSLTEHRLQWHKRGQDGSGKCDAHHTGNPEHIVWGVLYQIAIAEKSALDRAEALGVGYSEKFVEISTIGGPVTAQIYVAIDLDPGAVPYDWYKAFVIAGAHEHRLPAPYQADLQAVATAADPNGQRAVQNFAILGR
jgi:gamma-glutamylcyclotransferase